MKFLISTPEERLLGVKSDFNLFLRITSPLFVKKQGRIYTLLHDTVTHYINLKQQRNPVKALIASQFSYLPLTRSFHYGNLKTKINKIQERFVRLFYWYNLRISELLVLDNFVTVHHKNLQALVITKCFWILKSFAQYKVI